MFKIAVCDDEEEICVELTRIIKNYSKDIEVDSYTKGKDLYDEIHTGRKYDLIFLDIEMDDMDGIRIAKSIRTDMKDYNTQIVYVSGKTSYFRELFEVQPMHFIEKPIDSEIVISDIEKAMKILKKYIGKFHYKIERTEYSIDYTDILYFESDRRKVNIYTKNGKISFYRKLSSIKEELSITDGFLDVHESYYINKKHIKTLKYDEVVLVNSYAVPISQSRRKEIRRWALLKL